MPILVEDTTIDGYRVGGMVSMLHGAEVYRAVWVADGSPRSFTIWATDQERFRPERWERLYGGLSSIFEIEHPQLLRTEKISLYASGENIFVYAASATTPAPTVTEWAKHGVDGLTRSRVTTIVHGAANAVGALHRAGLVHGDVHGDRIHFDGVGTLVEPPSLMLLSGLFLTSREKQRRPTAPEFSAKAPVTPAQEVYELGALFLSLCFPDDDLPQSFSTDAPVRRLKMARLLETTQPDIARVVVRALAEKPDDRFHSAYDFARALKPHRGVAVQIPGVIDPPRHSQFGKALSSMSGESFDDPRFTLADRSFDEQTVEVFEGHTDPTEQTEEGAPAVGGPRISLPSELANYLANADQISSEDAAFEYDEVVGSSPNDAREQIRIRRKVATLKLSDAAQRPLGCLAVMSLAVFVCAGFFLFGAWRTKPTTSETRLDPKIAAMNALTPRRPIAEYQNDGCRGHPQNASAKASSKTLLQQAKTAQKSGDLTTARFDARASTIKDPGNIAAHLLLGELSQEVGQRIDAIASFQCVVFLAPESAHGKRALNHLLDLER